MDKDRKKRFLVAILSTSVDELERSIFPWNILDADLIRKMNLGAFDLIPDNYINDLDRDIKEMGLGEASVKEILVTTLQARKGKIYDDIMRKQKTAKERGHSEGVGHVQ